MKSILMVLMLVFLPLSALVAQSELDSYRQAASNPDPQHRIEALTAFLKQFPASPYVAPTQSMLFSTYLGMGKEREALEAGAAYVYAIQNEGDRAMAYNNVSYSLAEKGVGLDTALVYADRSVAFLREAKSQRLTMVLDTKAYVLYMLKRFEEAERLQDEAIVDHRGESDYVLHLALYQEATGKRKEALRTAVEAMELGDFGEPLTKFNEWIAKESPSPMEQARLRGQIVMGALKARLDTTKRASKIAEQSRGALVLANTGVELPTAAQWASQAVKSLGPKSSVEDVIAYKKSMAAVLSSQNKMKDAVAVLKDVSYLVPVWQSDFWLMAGKLYEKMGKTSEATDAYLTGLLGQRTPDLVAGVDRLNGPGHVDEMLKSKRESLIDFDPGHYKGKTNGKVVLAELFTGAECGPCQSADYAFDKLAEFYPRSALAILEYHVHIPGPDPMTTDETFDRYSSYGNTGTPTVYFDGGDQIVGGGPKYVAENRFEVYRYAIEKHRGSGLSTTLKAEVNTRGDVINVEVTVGRIAGKHASLSLHTALVERSIDYTGGNGISKHLFVVRDLANGAAGTVVSGKAKGKYKEQFTIPEIENEHKAYLDNPVGHRSWRMQTTTNWRSRPESLNRGNLAVVTWLQDTATKEVLTACYADVPSSMSTK